MKYQIINGDILDNLSEMPKNAFWISDPPYNQGYHYDNYEDNLDEQEYRDLLFNVFADKKSVIIHYPEQTINILATLDLGECKDVVSWVYPSNTAKQHRLITWWNCKPDMRKIGQPYKNPTDKRIKKRIENGEQARGYDWWDINQVKNVSKKDNAHSCPIPEEIARRIILSSTQIGDVVVDPFMGSGTVGKVALELGRNFIGVEISPLYCEIATNKIRNI